MDRAEIIRRNPIEEELQRRGIELRRQGRELVCCCPLHEDSKPSFRVNVEKQVWTCDPCGKGGSIIDLVMELDGIDLREALRRLSGEESPGPAAPPPQRPPQAKAAPAGAAAKIVKTYDYVDEKGALLYQVCRLEPKSFRQRHRAENGSWSWSMEGVRRVLYRLQSIAESDFVWLVEGEKDADNLAALGLCATCNVGGAGKWDASYSESLRGKEVVLCGDNDEPGQKHMGKVQDELAGKARSTRLVKIPSPHKDVSDWLASFPTPREGGIALINLADSVEPLIGGMRLPIKSMVELEKEYEQFVQNAPLLSLNIGDWLPSTRGRIRPLVPGELMTIVAGTGVGKTMLLQNLALHTVLCTLLFELELPGSLSFERFAAMATKQSGAKVFDAYYARERVDWRSGSRLNHIHVCSESKMTVAEMERIIRNAGLKTGIRPAVVMLDYVQLVQGTGDRRERVSDAAEELKVIAKATNTVVVMASQVARKDKGEGAEVFLHDAKESGSIENSSGLVLGAWRDPDDKHRMWLKVMKNTKGVSGQRIACRITEGLVIGEESPQPREA